MTGGFDEWAVARTPSLLAFASAVTEDADAADAAVTRALARIRPVWERVLRDDPDLEARRQVVRACAMPRRAAVVLRLLEERTDAEIAAILGCSEAAARRQLQRGLVEAEHRQPAASVHDDLVAGAGSAPTQLLTRAAAPPDLEPSPRRTRSSWLAALAVVALVGGVAYVSHESRTPAGVIHYRHVAVPASWRYESYGGVQVRVPDTWGWGSSPVTSQYFSGPQHLGACGSNQAYVLATDDASSLSPITGFVGRPSVTNQRCVTYGSDGSMPGGDAVWFDSPLSLGIKNVGTIVAETRQVGDQHVTAFSDNPDLRRQILGSAELVRVDANGCPTRPVSRATAGPQDLQPTSLSVCVYSQDTGVGTLMWSGRVSETGARAYAAAVAESYDQRTASCPTLSGRWVALGLKGSGGTRWDVADVECLRLQLADGGAPLSRDTVQSWAYGGVKAYVEAPRGAQDLVAYFGAPPS